MRDRECYYSRKFRGPERAGRGWGYFCKFRIGVCREDLKPWPCLKIKQMKIDSLFNTAYLREKQKLLKNTMNVSTSFGFCNPWKVTNSSVLTDHMFSI